MKNKKYNSIYSAIIGDALGVPYEFLNRDAFTATDMIGNGTHNQPVGTWSDDTSMMLCIIDSIGNNGYVNLDDIKDTFKQWAFHNYLTAHGEVFDIGNATNAALVDLPWHDKTSEYTNGNGSLMRTLPIGLLFESNEDIVKYASEISEITHGHIRSKICCVIYSLIVKEMINGVEFLEAYKNTLEYIDSNNIIPDNEKDIFSRIVDCSIITEDIDNIQSSGYVIHTLEATLWCIANSESFNEAILKAVNLGDDTDTTACVVGGIAGLIWEYDQNWYNMLKSTDIIDKTLKKLNILG